MGKMTQLILDGVLDYNTGEYIGPPCGYPRTKKFTTGRCKNPDVVYNKYGYDMDSWGRMKGCTQHIIEYLYYLGYKKISSRQVVLDGFMKDVLKLEKFPKNSRAYSIIGGHLNEFKSM